MITRLTRRLRAEDGTASVEFVIVFPVILSIFLAVFETGFLTVRHAMLERGLDMALRPLRLNALTYADMQDLHDQLSALVCDNAAILKDCRNRLLLELRPIDTETWDMPSPGARCIDRAASEETLPQIQAGGKNQLMYVRACVIVDPIFPGAGLGAALPSDSQGGLMMTAASVFVHEP